MGASFTQQEIIEMYGKGQKKDGVRKMTTTTIQLLVKVGQSATDIEQMLLESNTGLDPASIPELVEETLAGMHV